MEILPEIHQVDGVTGNSYIIVRDTLTIIDTGRPGNSTKIFTCITKTLNRQLSDVGTIILTHYHLDHTGDITTIKKAIPGAKVAVHAAEAAYIAGRVPIPQSKAKIGILKRIRKLFEEREFLEPDILLQDGDRIAGLVVIHIPGHTPGSLGLLDEKTRTFFAGDVFRYDGKILVEGPEEHTVDQNLEQESIRRIALLDIEILLVGHGVPLKPGAKETIRAFATTLPA